MRLVALVPALALPALAACSLSLGEGTRETITWKGPVAEGARFAYRNRVGTLRVEEGRGDSAELVLTVRRRGGASRSASLQVVQDARGLVACVQYDGEARCDAAAYDAGGASGGRVVNAVLQLPRDRVLDAATRDGSIEATVPLRAAVLSTSNARVRVRDVAGPLEITTSNGSVRALALRGPVTVSTSNASIGVTLDTLAGDVALTTSNGSVEAELPASASAALRATTSNGSLALRLPGTIRTQGKGILDAVLGGGAHRVTVTTSNASVTVRPRASGASDDDDDN